MSLNSSASVAVIELNIARAFLLKMCEDKVDTRCSAVLDHLDSAITMLVAELDEDT